MSDDHSITTAVHDPLTGTLTTRTETLRKVAATLTVTRRELEENPDDVERWVIDRLTGELNRLMAKAGRQMHGPARVEQSEDFMRDAVVFRLVATTRENHEGHWAEVWDAYHQDEYDRIHNLEENES